MIQKLREISYEKGGVTFSSEMNVYALIYFYQVSMKKVTCLHWKISGKGFMTDQYIKKYYIGFHIVYSDCFQFLPRTLHSLLFSNLHLSFATKTQKTKEVS